MAISAYYYCAEGDIKNICETHIGCNPSDMCRSCECYTDAWDCSDGYKDCTSDFEYLDLGSHGNSEYFFSMRKKRWNDAEEACKAKGGHLAIMETQNETDALNALMDQAPKYTKNRDIFIGGSSDEAKDGPWFWADGSSLSRKDPRWGFSALRNPYGDGPHCVRIRPWFSSAKYIWDITRCVYRQYYICETPTSTPESEK